MRVFAYIHFPQGFLPRVLYVSTDNIDPSLLNNIRDFKLLTLDHSFYPRVITEANIVLNDHVAKINGPNEHVEIWNNHAEDAPHRFDNDPMFDESIAYFPIGTEQSLPCHALLRKFILTTHIYDMCIEVVDYVIVRD